MNEEQREIETLIGRLRSLFDLLKHDQPILEADLERTASQVYMYSVLHASSPLSPSHISGLVELATAPEHPRLNKIRERAIGAQEMYSRLAMPARQFASVALASDSTLAVSALPFVKPAVAEISTAEPDSSTISQHQPSSDGEPAQSLKNGSVRGTANDPLLSAFPSIPDDI